MLSKLTIAGLHDYGLSLEDDLFENLTLPEGIDKDILVNEILKKGRSFALIYPNYEFMKLEISFWSDKWLHNFERWVEAYNFEYEALYNVDVTTVVEEHGSNSGSSSRDTAQVGTSGGTSGGTTTYSKAAYDASTLQNTGQDVVSNNENNSTSTQGSDVSKNKEQHDITTTETKQGNQGVTMSQEMLLSEYNAWKWNLYDHISDIFINEFCIMVYDI